MASLRCFVAVNLERDVHDAVIELRKPLSQVDADVRWVRPEGLHCTLRFLGSVDEARIDEIAQAAALAAHDFTPFSMNVAGVGVFPNWRRPRVLWVGIHADPLVRLASVIQKGLARLGFAAEERPFRPHLTLGRFRSLDGWSELRPLCEEQRDVELGESVVSAVLFYRSEPQRGGSVYTILGNFPLRGDASVTFV